MKFLKDPLFVSLFLLALTGGIVYMGLNYTDYLEISSNTQTQAQSGFSSLPIYQHAYIEDFENSSENTWLTLFNSYATVSDGIIFSGDYFTENSGTRYYCDSANYALFLETIERISNGKIIVRFSSYKTAEDILESGCDWTKISDGFFYDLQMQSQSRYEYKSPSESSLSASALANRYNLEYIISPSRTLSQNYSDLLSKPADTYSCHSTTYADWDWSIWNNWYVNCFLGSGTSGTCPQKGGGPYDIITNINLSNSNTKAFIEINANFGYDSKQLLNTTEQLSNSDLVNDIDGIVIYSLNSLSEYEIVKAFINTLRN